MPATAKQVTREYAKHTFPATATATAVFGFSCGVLAAVLNIRSAAALEGDSSNIMVPISTNAAVSWVIASLFCVPFVLDKAFRRADYLNSCLAVIGWPIRRQVRMLAGQFAIILAGGTVLSYPVSVVTQWGVVAYSPRQRCGYVVSPARACPHLVDFFSNSNRTHGIATRGVVSCSVALGRVRENSGKPRPHTGDHYGPTAPSAEWPVLGVSHCHRVSVGCDLSGGPGRDFRYSGFCAAAFLVCSHLDAAPHPRCGEGSGQSHPAITAFCCFISVVG